MRSVYACALAAFAAAACSTHPLTEETTGLTSHDIVHKVRCEAHFALLQLIDARGLAPLRPGLEQINKELERLKGELEKGEKHQKELDSVRAELIRRRARIDLEFREVINKIKLAENKNIRPLTQRQLQDLDRWLERIKRERLFWERDAVKYRQATSEHNEKVRRASQILATVELERKTRFKDLVAFYDNQAAFQFRFQITETNTVTAAGQVSFPIHLGNIKVDVGAGTERERYSERAVKLSASFENLASLKCDELNEGYVLAKHKYPIVGNIGLQETLEQYLLVAAGAKFTKQGESYIDEIQFTTTKNGNIKPQFQISPAPPRIGGSGSVDLSAKRKDLHEVIVYLDPGVPASSVTEKITYVRLIEDDPALGPSN